MMQCLLCDSYDIREIGSWDADGLQGPVFGCADCGNQDWAWIEDNGIPEDCIYAANRGPMISLKDDMEPCPPARTTLPDYTDPLRWWL